LVILLNGFQKKTQQTPKSEIDQAIKLMTEYYTDKTNEYGNKKLGKNKR
jgi:phage-related protein